MNHGWTSVAGEAPRSPDAHFLAVWQGLIEEGLDAAEAAEWANINFGVAIHNHIDAALSWAARDFDPDVAYVWAHVVGLDESEDARLWITAGFLPDETETILRSAGAADLWRDCEIDPDWCALYAAAGLSLSEARVLERKYADKRCELRDTLAVMGAMRAGA